LGLGHFVVYEFGMEQLGCEWMSRKDGKVSLSDLLGLGMNIVMECVGEIEIFMDKG
ncbi:hypothetical protein A2U01_0076722, partial [Trifolium medium]|nr:hypothetical protein [Trifolium medium]